jgi:hypothetical protein
VGGAVIKAIERWGGILVRPRRTVERLATALEAGEGRFDGWILPVVFVLGSQIQRLVETVAKARAFDSVLVLANGLALALLTPVLVALLVEGLVGAKRRHFRHLPLVALILCAVLGDLLRQELATLPGPSYLPEMLGTAWAAGLALWIRRRAPALREDEGEAGEASEDLEAREVGDG